METLIFPLLIALLAIPLFLQARKQKRTMQEQKKLQDSLTVGDRVMTTSGLFGTIVDTSDDSHIELEISPGMTTTWVRAAIREKVTTDSASDGADDSQQDEAAGSTAEATPSSGATSESSAEVAEPIERQKTT